MFKIFEMIIKFDITRFIVGIITQMKSEISVEKHILFLYLSNISLRNQYLFVH